MPLFVSHVLTTLSWYGEHGASQHRLALSFGILSLSLPQGSEGSLAFMGIVSKNWSQAKQLPKYRYSPFRSCYSVRSAFCSRNPCSLCGKPFDLSWVPFCGWSPFGPARIKLSSRKLPDVAEAIEAPQVNNNN